MLRELARRLAELAADEKNEERIRNWTRLNALDADLPPQVLVHLWPLARAAVKRVREAAIPLCGSSSKNLSR